MKAVFIVPESTIVSSDKNWMGDLDSSWELQARKRLWSTPSLSLITIAGMIPEESEVEYIDLNYRNDYGTGFDWAFFSPATSQINRAYEISDKIRGMGKKVAMGGPHISVLPEEALQHADVVFIGESEETFPQFLQDFENKELKRIYQSSRLGDLHQSPTPAYHLIKGYPYRSVPLQTSRGCPHQCSFCISSKIYGTKVRRKTVKQLENELQAILKVQNKPFIFFTDDNLLIDRQYNQDLFQLMKNSRLRWYAFSDASIAEEQELLSKLAKAGCTQLLIGFESLNHENLAKLNRTQWKMKKLSAYRNIIQRIQSFGIGVVGSFVLGMDHDTPDVFERLYEFIEETCLYATNITVLTPFPGTGVYESLKREGRLITEEWSRYNGFELTYQPKGLTNQEFEEGYAKLIQRLNSAERIHKVVNHFKTVFTSRSNDGNF